MKRTIKKTLKVILTIAFCIGFCLIPAETADGGPCLLWSLGWLAVCVVSAKGLDKLGAFNEPKDSRDE